MFVAINGEIISQDKEKKQEAFKLWNKKYHKYFKSI